MEEDFAVSHNKAFLKKKNKKGLKGGKDTEEKGGSLYADILSLFSLQYLCLRVKPVVLG